MESDVANPILAVELAVGGVVAYVVLRFGAAAGTAIYRPGVVHFCSDQVRTTHPRPGQRHLLTAPAPSQAVRGVLGKFADLPQEAEEEVRGLDEARRRITELERQIKHFKGTGAAAPTDQTAIERAVKAAVERERTAW